MKEKREMKTSKDLLIWQKSMMMAMLINKETRRFPKGEIYGLVFQLRRIAIAISGNFAEGFGRNSRGDFLRFLRISSGSLFEAQTQIEISYNLEYLSRDKYDNIILLPIENARFLQT